MSNVIDFKKSKERLLSKRFPNLTKKPNDLKDYFEKSNNALNDFMTIFYSYGEYISGKSKKEIFLPEVLVHFNRYFDIVYRDYFMFDSRYVPNFEEAIDYAMLSNGKRLRPFLMFLTFYFCGGEQMRILHHPMLAIEMIHTFSLIHDDMPCIDNDELRRGKPTVWKKYGEDMALLVGDALMMEASSQMTEMILEYLNSDYAIFPITSTLMLQRLAGLEGMILGETIDVLNTGKDMDLTEIAYMYDKKTTALLSAAIIIGANLSGLAAEKIEDFEKLAYYIGEAYQIKDDLLEIEGKEEVIGKSVNSDKNKGKVTYVEKVGVEAAKKKLYDLHTASLVMIDKLKTEGLTEAAYMYKDVINYLLKREK